MAQQHTRLNLTSAAFPLLSAGLGASVVVSSPLDTPLEPVQGMQREPAMKPQLIYCENLLPTTEGFKSVSFLPYVAAASPAISTFDSVFLVSTAADNTQAWFAPAGGTNQLWKGTTWVSTGNYGAGLAVTHANIAGQSYICYANTLVKRINITPGTLSFNSGVGSSDTLVYEAETHAQVSARFKAIAASGNYLIAISDTLVYWSNPLNPMDFTPSLSTGAGNATPSDLKGKLLAVVPTASGFILYGTQNAISATYSGNATYPWIFKLIAGSSGMAAATIGTVSTLPEESSLAYTSEGFQQFNAQGVTPIFMPVTEFIAAKLLETYNSSTGALTTTELVAELKVAITRINNRYAIVSYGIAELTHALVFDTALRRWGKLLVTHVAVVLQPLTIAGTNPQLCFVAANGAVTRLSLDATVTGATGVAIFGRIALTRSATTTVLGVKLESPKAADILTCKLATSYSNGQAADAIKNLTGTAVARVREYKVLAAGASHALHLTGDLNLTSLVITTTQGGFR